MRANFRMLSLLVVLAVGGCTTLPKGPGVRVLPAPGKSFEKFMVEDTECRQWASRSIGQDPQATVNRNLATGAALGTAVGAGVGAALGAISGDAGAGAAIGGGTGLLFGTASGASAGEVYGSEAQRRYDNTYVQCMYAKGNQVPGTVRSYQMRSTPPVDMYPIPPDYSPPK